MEEKIESADMSPTGPDPIAPEDKGYEPPAVTAEEPRTEVAEKVPEQTEVREYASAVPDPAAQQAPAVSAPGYQKPAEATAELLRKLNEEDDGEQKPPKNSKYEPMSSVGTALSLIALGIPFAGFIIAIVWACGACKKIGRRNLARATLILMVAGFVLSIIAALVIRFVYADDITRLFESLVPGYTINWG